MGKIGVWVTVVTVLASVANMAMGRANNTLGVQGISEALILGITMLVIAVPDGLPMAVVISLAYALNPMKNDHVLLSKVR